MYSFRYLNEYRTRFRNHLDIDSPTCKPAMPITAHDSMK